MSEQESKFTFIDLFAGIGGIRFALEAAGGKCVMTSEWNPHARKTYSAFFGEEEHFVGDITKVSMAEIPEHDILCGGFPCQPFSLAGVSSRTFRGGAHGFDDPTQGTLFFNVKEILRVKQPRGFLLENVKHLKYHDKGRTWQVIESSLLEVGYTLTTRIVDASSVVPQHRKRIFLVGLRNDLCPPTGKFDGNFFWSRVRDQLKVEARQQLRYNCDSWPNVGAILEPAESIPDRYILTPRTWQWLQNHRKRHEEKGNGFGYGIAHPTDARTRTLTASYCGEILIPRGEGEVPRWLTPLECLRLQGFPAHLEKFYDGTEPPLHLRFKHTVNLGIQWQCPL